MREPTPLTADQIRQRLRDLIQARYGRFDTGVLNGQLARESGVQGTTLTGYFGLLQKRRQTERLQEKTLRKILLALHEDPIEFLRGIQDRQLEFWPAAVPTDASSDLADGSKQLHRFAQLLSSLPPVARIRAARMGISAGVDALANAGEAVPDKAYDLVRELDSLGHELTQLRLLA